MRCSSCRGATRVVDSRPKDSKHDPRLLTVHVPRTITYEAQDWRLRCRQCKDCKAVYYTIEVDTKLLADLLDDE